MHGLHGQHDRDLSAITACYNKIKPPNASINGNEVDTHDEYYHPILANASRAPVDRQRLNRSAASSSIDIWNEVAAAKANAAMLTEAISFTPLEDLDTNALIKVRFNSHTHRFTQRTDGVLRLQQEFYESCQRSQSLFVDAVPWATTRAEQSRQSATPVVPTNQVQDIQLAEDVDLAQLHGGGGGTQEETTIEEQMLAAVLDANADVIAAFKMFDGSS